MPFVRMIEHSVIIMVLCRLPHTLMQGELKAMYKLCTELNSDKMNSLVINGNTPFRQDHWLGGFNYTGFVFNFTSEV